MVGGVYATPFTTMFRMITASFIAVADTAEALLLQQTAVMRCFRLFVTNFFCQSNKKPFGSPNVAESIKVFVLNHFTNELCTMLAESGYHLVDVFNSEHNT